MRRTLFAAPAALAALTLALAACKTAPKKPDHDAPLPPIDPTALDRSTSPCEDFYQYACGGWIARTEIPPDRSSWSRGFAELTERNARQLRRILDAAGAAKTPPPEPFAKKVGDYWASCMDEATIEARGLADLQGEWARIDAIQDRPVLADEVARLEAAGLDVPFNLTSGQDAKDATQVILLVYQGGLTLPDRDYYLTDGGKNVEIRQRYAEHLRKMFALAGLPPAEVEANASAVAQVEKALAETHWTRTEMRDPSRLYNRVDRAGLEKLAPAFPWARLFDGLGRPDLRAVSVTTPRFVEKVGAMFESAPLESWKAYLRWRLLTTMAKARALPRAFVDESFRFTSASFSGAKALRPRWKLCVDATDDALGFALGEIYVKQHFGADGKERTITMVSEIERSMSDDLGAIGWMDRATRAKALAKLGKVANKIGYPEKERDYSSMTVKRESYFRNVLSAGRFETARQLAKVGKPLDRTEWLMSPPTVNAYYEPSLNEMAFPAGILQPPFFNKAAPEPVNYGAIGMVVGHELTHGFDDEGRQYDGDGNLRDWWTPPVSKAFDDRARCVADQFSGYEVLPGVKVDGKLTLGENIADLGGLKLAFAAMQAARRTAPEGEKVEGFTPEQQFFVGYAQSWCSKFRDEETRLRVVTDPHSPPRFRVNGPLSNLPEFQAAFSCKEGNAMVRPEGKRCEVW
ncbi:M13 family metallopeptidase [Anaeromyxobacter oryzae]|uniref:Metallopeptidase n=1 Tax=Anaeromyxobacter oryzae TaxID=2918170 RepID=A0ABM7WR74_9BACT|nr:M13 family metallopeptidase [Anaeromyxobacter oryzae]BDG01972.1 metallopeptidase [Anaeromyxobacter oryzae]